MWPGQSKLISNPLGCTVVLKLLPTGSQPAFSFEVAMGEEVSQPHIKENVNE